VQSFNSALATDARGKSVAFPCIYEDAIARRRDRRGSSCSSVQAVISLDQ